MKKLLLLTSFITLSLLSHATILVVDSLNDSGTGSLRSKVALATSGDTIRFNPNLIANGSDSIVLTSQISFGKSLTFKGLYTNADTLFISGGNSNRIFRVDSVSNLTLDSLVLINGSLSSPSNGAALYIQGYDTLFVNNSMFRDNRTEFRGGAIMAYGNTCHVVINKSSFIGNVGGSGGGIMVFGPRVNVEIKNSVFTHNETVRSGGGAINVYSNYGLSKVEIAHCEIHENEAKSYGGGLSVAGDSLDMLIWSTTINRNKVSGLGELYSYGGGVSLSGGSSFHAFIENTDIIGNELGSDSVSVGAGIHWNSNYFAKIDFVNSKINENQITRSKIALGGGVHGETSSEVSFARTEIKNNFAIGDSIGNGGGVWLEAFLYYFPESKLDISHSTISKNQSSSNGGGIYYGVKGSLGQVTDVEIYHSTVVDNIAMQNGGALYFVEKQSWLARTVNIGMVNTTFYNNEADSGGGIFSLVDTLNLNLGSSIFALNGPTNIIGTSQNIIVSGGYNIFSDSLISSAVGTDQVNVDSASLNLGPLAYNGGFTPTMMPIFPSVAINMGNPLDSSDAQNVPIIGIRDVGAAEVCAPTFSIDSIVACNSYTWLNGVTYTVNDTSSIYTIPNTAGCDSTITLNLTINHSNFYTDTITACVSHTWIDGITYTANNTTAKDTLTNAVGCDSIITLNLTINPAVTGIDTIVACGSYTWIDGIIYTSSNTAAKDTLINVNGCDSVVTLDLTINQPSASTDVVTACDSLIWIDGITYTSNNSIATFIDTNMYGCDSVITLDLTINNSIQTTDVITECNTYTWINGMTYTASNTSDRDTLQTVTGCDSIVTLDLTINYSTTATDTHVVCDSLVWIDGVTYTTNNTTATHNIVAGSTNGCDSLVILDLTVNNSDQVTDVISACNTYTWIDGVTYTSSNNTATKLYSNTHGCDSLITLDLTINMTQYATDVISACGSYTWNGVTYTSNNTTAKDTLVTASGCDSIVTLDLTILQPTTGTAMVSACDTYTWNGITYTANNNSALDTLINAAGCDSIVTLDLTILNSTSSTETATACDSYLFNGVTYTASNTTASQTLVNAVGCDSIITLNLTINPAVTGIDTIVACGSYTWIDGIIYTSSNTAAKDTLINVNGCDSVVTLDLTINQPSASTDVVTACDSLIWIDGITYTSNNSIATFIDTNMYGCDSVITLDLTINNSIQTTDVITECDTYTWINGMTYTASNTSDRDTLQTVTGCDSIVTLDLTINYSTTATDTHVVCDSLVWIDGVTYTTNNTTATHNIVAGSTNGCDSLVTLDLTINNSDQVADVISACNTYTWIDGVTYTSSNNTATKLYSNTHGCDSLITLDLTINMTQYATDVISACGSYTWNGVTYTSNNTTAKDTLVTASGCDSIVTLDLTILQPTTGTAMVSACDTYTWNGITYTANNNSALDTLINAAGCDSIVTLDLTILNSTSSTETATACDSYLFNGVTYTASNSTVTQTLVNAVGCDSVITLNLTINNSNQVIDVISACNTYTWIDGITYTSSNNTAIDTLVNALGCDSIVTLDLTIHNTTFGTDVITACDSYIWNGITYSSSNNTATDTLVSAFGCDSIVTLDLTINPITFGIDSIVAVNQFTWIDGVTYTASNTSATHTITKSNGCDSVITLNLHIEFVQIGVNQNGPQLSVAADSGTFQWVTCPDYDVITGADDSVFTATENGSYAVIVTQNGYSDTSDCIVVNNVSVQEAELIGISLYPNPTSDVLHIDKGSNASLEITITNSAGATVHQSSTQNQITTINMAQLATGMYVVTLKNELGIKVEKVVKR